MIRVPIYALLVLLLTACSVVYGPESIHLQPPPEGQPDPRAQIRKLRAEAPRLENVRISPNGVLERRRVIRDIGGGAKSILDFHPDGSRIVAAPIFGEGARVFDVSKGRMLAKLDRRSQALHVRYTPDGRYLFINYAPARETWGEMRLLDARTHEIVRGQGGLGTYQMIAFTPDSQRIVMMSGNTGMVARNIRGPGEFGKVYAMEDWEAPARILETEKRISFHHPHAWSPSGEQLAVIYSDVNPNSPRFRQTHVAFWSPDNERLEIAVENPYPHEGRAHVNEIAWSADGRYLVMAPNQPSRRGSRDPETGEMRVIPPHTQPMIVWDIECGCEVRRHMHYFSRLISIQPLYGSVVASLDFHVLVIWDVETGAVLETIQLPGGVGRVFPQIAWHDRSRTLAVSEGSSIFLFRVNQK